MENTEDFSLEKRSSPKAHLMVVAGRLVPALLQFYRINDTMVFFSHLSASGKRLLYAAFFFPLYFTIAVPFCKTSGFKKTIAKLQL